MSLIPSNVKSYVCNTLTKCHETRTTIYYWVLNISVLTVFCLVLFCALYLCHRNKPSPEQLQERMLRNQYYVLQQIKSYQQNNDKNRITNLPVVENNDSIRVSQNYAPNLANIVSENREKIGIYNPNIL